jgi:gamma-glutamylputrescine oxidase
MHIAAMVADGFHAEPYKGPEGEGALFPDDGVFHPLQRIHLLTERAIERGAQIFEHSKVTNIASGIVQTASGSVHAKHTLVCVDGRLELVLPKLAGRVRTARLQMLATDPEPDLVLPRPIYSRFGYDYVRQLGDGRLVLGGFRDKGGEDEWSLSDAPTSEVQDHLEHYLRHGLGSTAKVTHRWAANVAFNPSLLPVIEEQMPNVWACGAYNGTGNVMSALAARAALDQALTGCSQLYTAIMGAASNG